MLENPLQIDVAPDLNVTSELGTSSQSEILASIGSVELSAPQLLACLFGVAVVIAVFAWYFERMQSFILRRTKSLFSRRKQPIETAIIHSFNDPTQQLELESVPRQIEVMVPDHETILEKRSESYAPELQEAKEEAPEEEGESQVASLDDVDTTHQQLFEELEDSKRTEIQIRTELETAKESLELQTAEVSRLDQNLAATDCKFSELESKNSSLETLVDSLQEKLDLAASELERQNEQNDALQSKIQTFENETIGLNEQTASLKQELARQNSDFDKLRIASSEAEQFAALNAASIEESQKKNQQLAEQLAETTQLKMQAQAELESAQESLKSLTADLAKADQEAQRKEEAAERMLKENTELKSDLEELERQRITAADDSKELADSMQAIETELRTAKEHHAQIKDKFESATLQIAELKTSLASSQAALDQNANDHATVSETLQRKLDEAVNLATETETQQNEVCQQLSSKLAQSEAELVSLRDETKTLNLQMANLTDSASQADELSKQLASKTEELEALKATRIEHDAKLSQTEAQVESFEKQVQSSELKLTETLDLLAGEQTLSAKLKKEVADRANDNADLTLQLAKYSELQASFELLNMQHQEVEQNLAKTSAELEQEQQLHSQLQKASADGSDELSSQVAKCKELEEQTSSLQKQAEEAERKLAETLDLLTDEQTLSAKLKKEIADQSDSAELTLQLTKHSELEASFELLNMQHQEVEQNLAKTSAELEQEQLLHSQLQKATAAGRDELEEQISVLRQHAEEAERKLTETLDLLTDEQASSGKLKKEIADQSEGNAKLTLQLAKHSELQTSFESLSLQHQEVEKSLAETSAALEQEQQLHSRLQKASADGSDELSSQLAKCQELEEQIDSLRQQAEEADRKLAASAEGYEQEKSLRLQLEETNQQLGADLDHQVSEHSKLEIQLRELTQCNNANSIKASEKLDQQQLKLDEVQVALNEEKAQRVELHQELESKAARIEELEKQIASTPKDEANQYKFLQQLKKYKSAHSKNKEYLKRLSAERAQIQEWATEYMAAANTLKSQLKEQREVTAKIQQKLDTAMANPSGGVDQDELKRIVQQQARDHVLSIKTQFELRLKKKNRIIRKLQKRAAAET